MYITHFFIIRDYKVRNKALDFLDFPSLFVFSLVFAMFFLVVASIPVAKIKKIQVLVNYFVFLTRKLECRAEYV